MRPFPSNPHASHLSSNTISIALPIFLALLLAISPTDSRAEKAQKGTSPYLDWEVGLRYFVSTGTTGKNLYGIRGSASQNQLISPLIYDDLTAQSAETFFKGTYPSGLFVKGYFGTGSQDDGSLTDQDFPPVVTPYSNTSSTQNDGQLTYGAIDIGTKTLIRKNYTIGIFAGYHYWRDDLHAFGCTQHATSTICTPTIPTSIAVISQDNEWHSLRLGVSADITLTDKVKLSGEMNYLLAYLDGIDLHHLRPDISPLAEDGIATGFQLEAALNYQLAQHLEIGIGGRYWRIDNMSNGTSHFETTPGGGSPQRLEWDNERYGAFLQGMYKFN